MDLLMQKIYEVFEANNGIFATAGLEPVRTMDIFRNQPLEPGKFEYFETPALFFDYRIAWERVGKKYDGKGTLEVHVVTDNPFETGSVFTNRQEALKKVFYYKIARKLLDDIESANTGKLYRIDESPIDTGVIVYHKLIYGFNYYDSDAFNGDKIDINDAIVEIVGKQLVKKL